MQDDQSYVDDTAHSVRALPKDETIGKRKSQWLTKTLRVLSIISTVVFCLIVAAIAVLWAMHTPLDY